MVLPLVVVVFVILVATSGGGGGDCGGVSRVALGCPQDRQVRLRLRYEGGAGEGDGHPQGEHHEARRRPLPSQLPRDRRALPAYQGA